jgi:hypothetical protein
MHFRKPSPTAALALTALFFALGGTALAARHYLITSTSQIKPSVLKALHGVTGRQGPTGPQGTPGAQGAPGVQGPPGPTSLSTIIEVVGPKNSVPAKKVASSRADCPSGTHIVSGGDNMFAGEVAGFDSEAERPGAWFVIVANPSEYGGGFVQAIAYCAGAGQAVAASAPKSGHPREAKAIDALSVVLSHRLQVAHG